MKDLFHGELEIIGMRGCSDFCKQVDNYICDWRGHERDSYISDVECPRFGTGEAKGLIHDTQRGKDVYIIVDCFNYGPETYYNMLIEGKDLLITIDRDYYRPLMADSYHNLALLYRKTNRLKEAKEMAVEAYVIYKRLTRKDSKKWKKTLENTGNLLDDIEARLGR